MLVVNLFIFFFYLQFANSYTGTPITTSPFLDTISNTSNGNQYYRSVNVSEVRIGQTINVKFEIVNTSVLTSTFVMISYDHDDFEPGQIGRQKFYGKKHSDFEGTMDLTNMQTGTSQVINKVWNGQPQLYFTVYNLDPPSRRKIIQFRIYISYSNGKVHFTCNGGIRNFGSDICRNCPAGYYGQNCAVNMFRLSDGVTSSVIINGPQMKYFMITQTQQLNILVKQSVGYGEAYFQFVQFEGQFASYTNVAVGRSLQGRFDLQGGTKGTTISAKSSGAPMTITVAVYGNISTQIQLYYKIQKASNLLLIILGAVGGVLLVILLIGGCYIIRKSGVMGAPQQARAFRSNIENQLSAEEIERFFPTVLYKDIYSQEGQTMENINQPRGQVGQDCVICLCEIENQNEIKITFCKHIFHAKCLVGWFSKQQTCPYCRQEFNKSNTIRLYRKLKATLDNKILKGSELVRAIINSKKSFIISKQEIQQKSMEQVIVRPNHSVEIQNINS